MRNPSPKVSDLGGRPVFPMIGPSIGQSLKLRSLARVLLLTGLLVGVWACGKASEAVVSISLHPTKPNILYVATNDAVYKTRDGGATWKQLPTFSARRVVTVAIDPKFPATVYAGMMGDAVYKSPDGGQRWLPHNVGLKEHVSYVNQFVFHPHDTQMIYAATTVGVFRTRDGGRLWNEQMKGMKEVHIVVTLAMNPKNPEILYAGTTGGVYRSADGAATWRKVNNGLIPAEILDSALSLGVNTLMVDPVTPDTVYAGTTKGLFKTTDEAKSWLRVGESLPDQFISTLVIGPTRPQVLYEGGRAGIHKSLDGGQSWQAINEGLETLNVRSLVMSPHDPRILYAGTNGSGLYLTSNAGETWQRIPLNPASPPPDAPRT